MNRQFQLVSKAGMTRGVVWKLAEKPILIGRDETCDISIVDPLVSRRHCQIHALGDTVHVEDLGSRNTTLVNGTPTMKGILRLGDEVAVGRVCLVLTRESDAEEQACEEPDDDTTLSIRQSEAFYVSGTTVDFLASGRVHTVRDLADLYAVSRLFGFAVNAQVAARELSAWLEARFKPAMLWIGLAGATGEDFEYPVAPREFKTPEGLGIGKLVNRSLEELEGILTRTSHSEDKMCMVAPMAVGEQQVGVIALCSGRAFPYAENDLQLLLAVASTSAAWFLSFERLEELRRENETLRGLTHGQTALIGVSDAMKTARSLVRKASSSDLPVLLLGETGCGKELAARLIHRLSERKGGPFVAINCAAIPEQLLESELFGHEKGAFTGAERQKTGLIESSHWGTLLLDEIGHLSMESQAKLLRVLEDRKFRRIGGTKEIAADFRLISATNTNLRAAIERREFRPDLYYRIAGLEITMPPLRQRPSDIPVLASHFLANSMALTGRRPPEISPDAMVMLQRQAWPGNVRELKAALERAVLVSKGTRLECDDFRAETAIALEMPDGTLREVEMAHIERVLKTCGGRVSEAAKRLGISRTALYEKMERYGIQR